MDIQSPSEDILSTAAQLLREQGYCVLPQALHPTLWQPLKNEADQRAVNFKPAGIGRAQDQALNASVRRDHIQWIEPDTEATAAWLKWADQLRLAMNRQLMLGLFSFESHFAHYAPGAFYGRHVDAFVGQANRVLSLVTYLNPEWQESWGGELVLYAPHSTDQVLAKVAPQAGTVVLFLSEEFPHEVKPANHTRHSIAGWFRLNSSHAGRIDPPQ